MKTSLLSLLAGLAASTILATSAIAEERNYLKLNVGQTTIDPASGEMTFVIGAGREVNKNIAFEFDFAKFGKSSISDPNFGYTESIDSHALRLSLLAKANLEDNISLYGRLGMAKWDFTYTESVGSSGFEYRDDGVGIYYGLGIEMRLDKNASLTLEFDEVPMDADLVELDASTISIGAQFSF